MVRATTFCAAMFVLSTFATLAEAKDTKVVVTVETARQETAEATKPPFEGKRASVDVAILLDTSNSMDGLINQAKSQLWTIVQQFAKAKKNGQTPVLRVALFEYGNTGLPAAEGYIRQAVSLTDDLDKLSEALFALSTNGGDEYCGQVVDEAITRLDWSKEPNSYKAIFIAGNEPFTQGTVDYQQACRRAIQSGVVVNTIHCGANREGVDGMWQHAASLAEGEFFNIDQDRAIVHIKCPQDEIIIRLNAELNKTYLWYGGREEKAKFAENQVAQDANASATSESVAVGRAITKAGRAYSNRGRDLIDATAEDEEVLARVKEEELPESLQAMSPEERKAHVSKLAARRAEVQQEINRLAAEREEFLAKERQRLAAETGDETLGDAVVAAVQRQLAASGFETEAVSE
ncbi:MAG: VWA domain-containing protein [Planctomycetales bacterium]|nr:VWA domain-containing protein [Planctomycetales bacterium]